MKINEIEKILNNLELEKEKFYNLREIKSIKLKSGREIFPDWLHMRIKFTKDSLKIIYGHSYPYGGRLPSPVLISGDYKQMSFKTINGKIPLLNNPFSEEDAEEIRFGDTLICSNGERIISENPVINVYRNQNLKVICLAHPLRETGRLSFFHTEEYTHDYLCDHSESIEGIFMKFKPNSETIKRKEIIHEIIKYKDITEINLNLKNNKKFSIKGEDNSND